MIALQLTDDHRSMIASAFVGAYDYGVGSEINRQRSLCCANDALEACTAIVGEDYANALHSFVYEGMGCCGWRDADYQATNEQYFLDKIAELKQLRHRDGEGPEYL